MPKNKGKGGKNRKRGKNENLEDTKRELIFKSVAEGEDYAQVMRMLGGGNVEAMCLSDQKRRVCRIRGKLHKKIWINVSDIVLVSIREFEQDKADLLLKYTIDEARQLQRAKEIPKEINLAEAESNVGGTGGPDGVYFGNSDDDESSDNDEEFKEILSQKREYDVPVTDEEESSGDSNNED